MCGISAGGGTRASQKQEPGLAVEVGGHSSARRRRRRREGLQRCFLCDQESQFWRNSARLVACGHLRAFVASAQPLDPVSGSSGILEGGRGDGGRWNYWETFCFPLANLKLHRQKGTCR